MKLNATFYFDDDSAGQVVDLPTTDSDVEATVHLFGVILRSAHVPNMSQVLLDGTNFVIDGENKTLVKMLLVFEPDDEETVDGG